jgi:hypothetical protein
MCPSDTQPIGIVRRSGPAPGLAEHRGYPVLGGAWNLLATRPRSFHSITLAPVADFQLYGVG